jgi:hypothetical protein
LHFCLRSASGHDPPTHSLLHSWYNRHMPPCGWDGISLTFFTWLASNLSPLELYLQSSWDYRQEAPPTWPTFLKYVTVSSEFLSSMKIFIWQKIIAYKFLKILKVNEISITQWNKSTGEYSSRPLF